MSRRARGFTLLEVAVALLIMVYLIIIGLYSVKDVTLAKYARAQRDALAIYNGIWGTVDANGYYGDVGALPSLPNDTDNRLRYLLATRPPAVTTQSDGAGQGAVTLGWHGPYVLGPADFGGAGMGTDPWQHNWIINPLTGSVTSVGPDGLLGTADDIVMPQLGPTPLGPAGTGTGTIEVTVVDPSSGAALTDPTTIQVSASDPNGAGVGSMIAATAPVAGQEAFTITGLHPGRHLVEVVRLEVPNAAATADQWANAAVYASGNAFASVRIPLR